MTVSKSIRYHDKTNSTSVETHTSEVRYRSCSKSHCAASWTTVGLRKRGQGRRRRTATGETRASPSRRNNKCEHSISASVQGLHRHSSHRGDNEGASAGMRSSWEVTTATKEEAYSARRHSSRVLKLTFDCSFMRKSPNTRYSAIYKLCTQHHRPGKLAVRCSSRGQGIHQNVCIYTQGKRTLW